MEERSGSFEEFAVEMGDYEIRKLGEFDRIWKIEYGGSISGSPLLFNGIVYFGCADHFVYAVNAEDGRLVWKFRTRGGIIEGSVMVHDGVVYFGSFDQNMYAVRAGSGKLIWKYKTRDKIACTPAYSDGMIYFGGKDHFVYALKAETGELVWKYRTFAPIVSEPTVVNEKVMIGSYDHFLYCLNKKTGELFWKFKTQGELHGPSEMAVKDGIIYFSSFDNNLRAVEIETGRLIWKKKMGNFGCEGQPRIYDDMIFHTSRDGMLYTLNTRGELLWKFRLKEVPGEPCVFDGKLYQGADDHYMRCISLDGKELWRFKTQSYVWYKPIKTGNRLIFGSWDCNLYCIDVNTQQVIWKFSTGGSPSPLPPSYAQFEIRMNVPETEKEEAKKTYDLDIKSEGSLNTSTYKSRITYQVSTQYASKGKYQVDSDEEEF